MSFAAAAIKGVKLQQLEDHLHACAVYRFISPTAPFCDRPFSNCCPQLLAAAAAAAAVMAHGGRLSSLFLAPSWRVLSSDELVSLIAAAAAR